MSEIENERLYNLLPVIYRIRDADQGEPLRALLGVMEEEFLAIEQDIAGLYEDLFIETCDEWVIPYIGDLLNVHGVHPISARAGSLRSYVANTIAYRRRKGTAAVLEQVARDITGWPAHAVEFFQLLGTTQHLNHLRMDNVRTPDLRDTNNLELLGGPFETTVHTAEIRSPKTARGKYNIPNIGIFLWRLQSYPMDRTTAREISDKCYTFDPTGKDIPLFNQPQTEDKITHLAEEINVPAPLRRLPLYNELEARREELIGSKTSKSIYFGKQPVLSLSLIHEDQTQPDIILPEDIRICNLTDWGNPPASPDNIRAAVDPVLGRLMLSEYLFSWDDIPGNDDGRLINFLKTNIGIDWVKTAKIEKIDDDKTITVYTVDESLSLKLNDDKSKMSLEIDGGITYEFIVKTENDKLNIYISDSILPKPPEVLVSYSYGFSHDVGAGPYTRTDFTHQVLNRQVDWQVGVSKEKNAVGIENIFPDLASAVEEWNEQPEGTVGVIAIMDSRTYNDELTDDDYSIKIPNGSQLLVVAADWPVVEDPDTFISLRLMGQFAATGLRPHLMGDIHVNGTAGVDDPNPGELVLDGILIEGKISVVEGNLGSLQVGHCTLVPKSDGIEVLSSNDSLKLTVRQTICGGIVLSENVPGMDLIDSIIDMGNNTAIDAKGTTVRIEQCTILGKSYMRKLEAGNSIFKLDVEVEQRQAGCMRFCFAPYNSSTPRRFQCQPDLALSKQVIKEKDEEVSSVEDLPENIKDAVLDRMQPVFTSLTYGEPAYSQLSPACPVEIFTGAEDNSEMGVFSSLQQPQREKNLLAALEEYLRFGLEAGFFYTT